MGRRSASAFTLLELLLAIALATTLLTTLAKHLTENGERFDGVAKGTEMALGRAKLLHRIGDDLLGADPATFQSSATGARWEAAWPLVRCAYIFRSSDGSIHRLVGDMAIDHNDIELSGSSLLLGGVAEFSIVRLSSSQEKSAYAVTVRFSGERNATTISLFH
ncbi:MAG: hypothetical protein LBI39_04685 [Puniceicoccales bacterium]|jgi:hypothetical protein|nr:hypothetical protein [Puniceicoccales bacterium]